MRDTYSQASDLTDTNPACAASFMTFLNLMGRKINLQDWTGYKGDMGSWKTGTTYFEEYQDIEGIFSFLSFRLFILVIYHVAPMLSSTQHRQWIGNDSLIIFFLDEEAQPFQLEHLSSLGTIPSCFAVVKPARGGKYEYYFISI